MLWGKLQCIFYTNSSAGLRNLQCVHKDGLVEEMYKYLNIKQIWFFPAKNWESGFCFGFWKEGNWVSHCKTLAQLTSSNSKTEKDSSYKGKENSNLMYGENLYMKVSSTKPPIHRPTYSYVLRFFWLVEFMLKSDS